MSHPAHVGTSWYVAAVKPQRGEDGMLVREISREQADAGCQFEVTFESFKPCPDPDHPVYELDGPDTYLHGVCMTCRGRGRVPMARWLVVEVPAGVEHETRIRYRGLAGVGLGGGEPGDLYVQIDIEGEG